MSPRTTAKATPPRSRDVRFVVMADQDPGHESGDVTKAAWARLTMPPVPVTMVNERKTQRARVPWWPGPTSNVGAEEDVHEQHDEPEHPGSDPAPSGAQRQIVRWRDVLGHLFRRDGLASRPQ